jgi:hypothetical protein
LTWSADDASSDAALIVKLTKSGLMWDEDIPMVCVRCKKPNILEDLMMVLDKTGPAYECADCAEMMIDTKKNDRYESVILEDADNLVRALQSHLDNPPPPTGVDHHKRVIELHNAGFSMSKIGLSIGGLAKSTVHQHIKKHRLEQCGCFIR